MLCTESCVSDRSGTDLTESAEVGWKRVSNGGMRDVLHASTVDMIGVTGELFDDGLCGSEAGRSMQRLHESCMEG